MKQYTVKRALALASMAILIAACTDSNNNSGPAQAAQPVPADEDSVYAAANQCVAISVDDRSNFITTNESGDGYQVIALEPEQATRFMMRPADLGIYLL